MNREILKDLIKFLKPYDKNVVETTLLLRDFIIEQQPDCNELIYDNYNAVAIGFSTTDRQKELYCHVPVYTQYVNIGFNKGTQLDDLKGLLKGTGNSIRHITVYNLADFSEKYRKRLLKQTYNLSIDTLENKEQKIKGQLIIKSISATKKRPS
ncbi:MAG: hypothetical protein IPN73_16675 [Saprospiraceae bacterium]|nr:hypothetical protein [Saprospiraceae bacterium]MBK8851765.1 hypothetical protein [Saprospiraceae bacterium]